MPERESADGDEPIFKESDGLTTRQDLQSFHGTSPVTVRDAGDRAEFEIGLSGGHVAARMTPDRAREAGEALIEAAERIDGNSDSEEAEP